MLPVRCFLCAGAVLVAPPPPPLEMAAGRCRSLLLAGQLGAAEQVGVPAVADEAVASLQNMQLVLRTQIDPASQINPGLTPAFANRANTTKTQIPSYVANWFGLLISGKPLAG